MGQGFPKTLAVVTEASTGISYELAIQCTKHGFDLVVAADEPEIAQAAEVSRKEGVSGGYNKLQSGIANITPAGMLAERHRKMVEPGSAKN